MEAQSRLKEAEEISKEDRRRRAKEYDEEEKLYMEGLNYFHGTIKSKMDYTLQREWESRVEYRKANQENDLLLLWLSMEQVVKRKGGETAFTVSAAKIAFANRKQGETETIASFVSAVEVLIMDINRAGG